MNTLSYPHYMRRTPHPPKLVIFIIYLKGFHKSEGITVECGKEMVGRRAEESGETWNELSSEGARGVWTGVASWLCGMGMGRNLSQACSVWRGGWCEEPTVREWSAIGDGNKPNKYIRNTSYARLMHRVNVWANSVRRRQQIGFVYNWVQKYIFLGVGYDLFRFRQIY